MRTGYAELGRSTRVMLLSATLWSTAAVGWSVLSGTSPRTSAPHLPWWGLAALFAAVEAVVLHVQIQRESQAISLSDIPVVLGLFFATPGGLLAGRLAGAIAVCVLYRRQRPLKVVFNASLFTAHTATALATFHLVLGGRPAYGVLSWLAAYLAVGAASLVSAAAVAAVIALHEDVFHWRDVRSAVTSSTIIGSVVTTVSLVAVAALRNDPLVACLLVASAVALLLGYRGFAALQERHLGLSRVYHFTQVLGNSPEVDEILRRVIAEARQLLRAEGAHVSFVTAEHGGSVQVRVNPDGTLARVQLADGADPLLAEVLTGGKPVLVTRNGRQEKLRAYLAADGRREAIVVPLRGEAGIVGTLAVGDRMGEVRGFDRSDVQLLETVANHASMALQNGQLVDQLRHEALHDALTGLPNRAHLLRDLSGSLERLDRGQTPGVGVILLDLDGFKEVNDTLGHGAGDLLLGEIAQRLRTAAGPAATVARLGGDEFAIAMHHVAAPEHALATATCLLTALERPVTVEGVDVEVGGSFGVSLAPEHARDSVGLLKRADVAMYAAKSAGGGVRLYDTALDVHSPQRLALAAELRQALGAGQLVVHLQPQVSLATGTVLRAEALVRWAHPQRGLLMPDEFVPVAERSGLIRPLTSTVLRIALAACAHWRSQGQLIGVAVNLSVRSLTDPALVEEVAALLAQYGLPGHLLTLELTESSIMTDPVHTAGLLQRLADMGVRLSIDDFGTGYSSLSYLKKLPVHEVKIDKTFVAGMHRDSDDAAIVRSIVDLGANLGLEVVAEGVEDDWTWRDLAGAGCDLLQGYHISRPMPVERFAGWMDAYNAPRLTMPAPGRPPLPVPAPGRPRPPELPAELATELATGLGVTGLGVTGLGVTGLGVTGLGGAGRGTPRGIRSPRIHRERTANGATATNADDANAATADTTASDVAS